MGYKLRNEVRSREVRCGVIKADRWEKGNKKEMRIIELRCIMAKFKSEHSGFLKFTSKRHARSQLVNRPNGPLPRHENSINIRGTSPERDPARRQAVETADVTDLAVCASDKCLTFQSHVQQS
ncbi:hypothetical protein EVAR_76355_1 [Eumeta japonica]|uniref:Uncharacterized protein n=1 Tax=Eumeta variegata TaxID=151549 RepID=A0A4C1T7K3_EUMVA|nr:hypothetical protein EVAR_76355_1 [Eumeta japonica]